MHRLSLPAILLFLLTLGQPSHAAETKVDFVRDVQPIFATSCYKCHGPQKQKGKLRLDSKTSTLTGGDSGKLFSAGQSGESYLIKRLKGEGDEDRMPLKAPALSDAQIATIKAWIDQGAEWPDSASVKGTIGVPWSFVKPVRPTVPAVKNAGWVRNPIDNFVLARLEKEGLKPSGEASREELIRRVSLDLIGLPPAAREIDAFLSDTSADAYERLVDRLLASPHYGERWAIPWLDLARYADSNGYEKDRVRSMWPYRDWVIDALNRDMPFDQFTIEQIAGDLLPDATIDQKIATGFNRNTMMNEEGGVDEHEYYYYAAVDRVNTTATVWMGATLGCAQCHNHKFDPFSQKDYYRFLAYFNSTAEETRKDGGTDPHDVSPKVSVDSPGLTSLKQQLAILKSKLAEPTPALAAGQAQWERKLARSGEWTPLALKQAVSAVGTTLSPQPDGSVLAEGPTPPTDTYTLTTATSLENITAVRLEVLPDPSLRGNGPGRAPNGNFVLTHLSITAAPADGSKPAAAVHLRNAMADFSQNNYQVEKAIAEKVDLKSGWGIAPKTGEAHSAIFETSDNIGFKGGSVLTFELQQLLTENREHVIGRLRLAATTSPRGTSKPPPNNITAIIAIPTENRTTKQGEEVASYYRSIAIELQPVRSQIAEVEKKIAAFPASCLVMKELPTPRESFVHIRGGYLTVGEKVEPGIPSVFAETDDGPVRQGQGGPLPQAQGGATTRPNALANRLDLARWLVSPENPLTARVTVNRLWEQYFGKGIVATSEDFGMQGDPPTHPELLDWLATEFMHPAAGPSPRWSLKAIGRLIVTSAVYRQASRVTPELLEKDPFNKLLARGPRFRLPAELIRDSALEVSGLLSDKVGGPSVFPSQPAGIWRSPYNNDQWEISNGPDRYRRGIYTFLRRSAPYPQFSAFDKTTHEAVCTRRSRTDTSLQALTTLNDPAFMEAAAALARKTLDEGGASSDSRAAYVFRTVLSRKADGAEVRRLVVLHEQMLAAFTADAKAAQELASAGKDVDSKTFPVSELAAWTAVANVVLNLDEAVTKE